MSRTPSQSLHLFTLTGGPLQLVSAIEVIKGLGLDEQRCVLVTTARFARSPLLAEVRWKRVSEVRNLKPSPIRRIRALQRHLDALRFIRATSEAVAGEQVAAHYMGVYGFKMRATNHRIVPRTTAILDDGTATIINAIRRRDDLLAGRHNPDGSKDLLRRVMGLDNRHIQQVHYFSLFSPPLLPSDRLTLVGFDYFRNSRDVVARPADEGWLIGFKLYLWSTGICEEAYFSLVLRAIRELKALGIEKLTYFADMAERRDVLRRRLPADVEIETSDLPLELRALNRLGRPAAIASFISSALITLAALFEDAQILYLRSKIADGEISSYLSVIEKHALERLLRGKSMRVLSAGLGEQE